VTELDSIVRRARWSEYFALAGLAARRLAEAGSPGPAGRRPLHRAGLWLATMLTLSAYGAWTTDHHQAMATSWVLDDHDWAPVRRASPVLVLMVAAELTLFVLSPGWVPVVLFLLLCIPMARLCRQWWARADLRAGRRRGAVFVANLVSAHKGAGRVVLDHIIATAAADDRFTALEARAALMHYYEGCGFTLVRTVDAGDGPVLYMERSPKETSTLA
jgi:hypothetical protein